MMANDPTPSLGRPVNEEARAEKRIQILNGAKKCFIEQGFHKATMASIAKEAKVNVASIYQYFENKDAVIEALVDIISGREIELLYEFHPDAYDYANLRAFISQMYTTPDARDFAALRSEILSEAARNPKISDYVSSRSAKVIQAVTDFVRRFQQFGEMAEDVDPESAAAEMAYFHEGIQTHIPLTPDNRANLLEIHMTFIASRLGVPRPNQE